MNENRRLWYVCLIGSLCMLIARTADAQAPGEKDAAEIRRQLAALQTAVADLKQKVSDRRLVADVEVYTKAADWILRHNEFYRPQ